MSQYLVYFLVLGVINVVKTELSLRIVKNIDNFVSPVSDTVEEKSGTTFSLICELDTSSDHNTDSFDDNLSWVKGALTLNQSRFIPEDSAKTTSETGINKSEKKFDPLQPEDKGNYICVSLKFNLFKSVSLKVRRDVKRTELRPLRETNFCNDQMFQCMSNGICIMQRYVCDGKPDCKDKSDESLETCKGDPCKDKILCEDGRCIPTVWCCDRHHDLNCTVTNRPKCCQILSESYEELEYFPNVNQSQHNGARYLFILVCILSILFSIVLLLLILSKVVIFAKKSALQQQRHNFCENIALRNQSDVYVTANNSCLVYPYTNQRQNLYNRNIADGTDVSDPLLFPPRFNTDVINDQPPSYIDVLRNTEMPPPYTSREMLNENERRN